MAKMVESQKGTARMTGVEHYKNIFARYGGMMRTKQLEEENILYRKVQQLIQEAACAAQARALP